MTTHPVAQYRRTDAHVLAWWTAIAAFGYGDLLTTTVGLRAGAVELNPVLQGVADILTAMIAAKAAVLGFGYVADRVTTVGVAAPVTLAIMGVAITTWNLGVYWSL